MKNRILRNGSALLAGTPHCDVRTAQQVVFGFEEGCRRVFKLFFVVAAMLAFILSTGLVRAAGFKTLSGHIPAAIARMNLQPISNLAGTNRLRLAIGLPLHNQAALTNLLRQLYDPASPDYHHFLTPKQFTDMFGPSEHDYQAVIAFAKANGLTLAGTYSNRMLVDVSAPVADVERAFHLKMRLYKHPKENRDFYAPDTDPNVPAGLPIQDISGLSDYHLPHPMLTMTPISNLGKAKPRDGSGPLGLYMGYDFRNAYVPGVSLTGSGQTVGLLEFDGYYPEDITAYVNQAGLPGVTLENVPVNGGVSTPGPGNGEVALDIDMVMAMAPDVDKIVVFEAPNPSPWVDMLNAMAADTSIKQFSCSWGGGPPNPAGTNGVTADQIFQEMAAQGQSFFNASGDSDAFTGAIPFPSEDPYITQVGGTTLTMNGSGSSYSFETVWNWGTERPNQGYDGVGSSGGVSPTYQIPSWQQGINMSANQGSTSMRNIPDVAMTADNIYIFADNGVQYSVGGTSAAAPLWAGFIALVNQQAATAGHPPVGFINPAIYNIAKTSSYASDFHDVTLGNNTWSGSPTKYFAGPGYDLCTGLGTPNGANLIGALIGKRTGILQMSVNPPSGSVLLQGQSQAIFVTVSDIYGITNATVTATVTNSLGAGIASLTFTNNGNGNYGSVLSVPAAANPLTMTVAATAPGEIGITNTVNYSIVVPPPNDNFANATKIPVGGASYVENNQFATIQPDEPFHDGDHSRAGSLWWSWTPAVSTNVFLSTVGSRVDNVVAVYTGGVLSSNMPQVAAASGSVSSFQPAQTSFAAQAYRTYYIAVASASSNSLGTVALNVTPGGRPDTNAPVVFVSYPQSGQTVFAPFLAVLGTALDPGTNTSGVAQVYVATGDARLTAAGTTNWSSVVPLQPGLNIIKASAVDQSGNISAPTTVQVNYLIQPPANDYFVNGIPLSGTTGSVVATNTAATKEVGEPNPTGNAGGKSLWWTYTPSSDGVLTLNTSNSTFDTIMGLYTGTNVANLTTVADNDDAYSEAPGGFSFLQQAVRAHQTYHILVDGYDGASGRISLGYSFASAPVYHLTVNTSGGGAVQLQTTNALGGVATLPSASADFAGGANVVLTALPDRNNQFDIWSGGASSVNNPVTVVMNGNLSVTANFVNKEFTDGFESGDLHHLSWTTAGDAAWFVQSNIVDVGQYAAQSGAITNSQSSSLILSTNFAAGTGSFDFKVSSEQNWDFLKFYVDTNLVARWSGDVGWERYSFPITAGRHTLEWTYAKDATISLGLDAAFIDDVNLPIALAPSAATPAQIQLQQQTDGGLFMNLSGQVGQQYVIQVSPDLVHWQNVSTNIAYGGFIRVPLPANTTNRTQFYRAIAP